MYLSVIIPAYNEEKRITKTLREIDKYLKTQSFEYEILMVDDGSKDNTVKTTESLVSDIKNLKVLTYGKNRGKGYAVKYGLLAATGKYRLFTDADNSTSIDQVEKMWPWFNKGFDIVLGSRDVKGAVLDPPQPWLRNIILGKGFKIFRKLVIDLWFVEDTQCGFKCFSEKVTSEILPKCRIDRFAFDPEILILAKKAGYKIKEIPVYWKNDSDSKVKPISILNMALDLFRIRWNLLSGKYK
ncbi:MAG: dolichyl-phosphate beta-glucosyltransferase [Candidatus Nealsonbacteria bacterium]